MDMPCTVLPVNQTHKTFQCPVQRGILPGTLTTLSDVGARGNVVERLDSWWIELGNLKVILVL